MTTPEPGACPCTPATGTYRLGIEDGTPYLIHDACGLHMGGDWATDALHVAPIPVTVGWHAEVAGDEQIVEEWPVATPTHAAEIDRLRGDVGSLSVNLDLARIDLLFANQRAGYVTDANLALHREMRIMRQDRDTARADAAALGHDLHRLRGRATELAARVAELEAAHARVTAICDRWADDGDTPDAEYDPRDDLIADIRDALTAPAGTEEQQ